MNGINALHLHMLLTGRLTQAQVLAFHPEHTSTTLTAALNSFIHG